MSARLCANCVERPATHDDSEGYPCCDSCDYEPAVEGHGIERGYEPSGGLLTAIEAGEGARRAMGKERFERDTYVDKHLGIRPSPRLDQAELDERIIVRENQRRNRSGANKAKRQSSRERKVW